MRKKLKVVKSLKEKFRSNKFNKLKNLLRKKVKKKCLISLLKINGILQLHKFTMMIKDNQDKIQILLNADHNAIIEYLLNQ